MEGDIHLRFYPNGKVRMAANNMGIQKYVGFYEIDANGKIVMTASELGQKFPEMPVMVLKRGEKVLMLLPRGPKHDSRFWEFRMIPPGEKSPLNE